MDTKDKVLLGFSIATFFTSVAYAVFGKKIHARITENKNDREPLAFTKSLNAVGSIQTAIPITKKGFYTSTESAAIKSKLDAIYKANKSIIDTCSKLNKIPVSLINSVIFIESAGDKNAVNGYAVGLMQIEYTSATDIVTRERQNKTLTEQEKVLIKKYVGEAKFNKIMKASMGDSFFTKAEVLKPELNILLGTMYLGQIIKKENVNSTGRLDRMIIRYNLGFYTKKIPSGDVNAVLNSPNVRQVSKDYVLKLGGKNGTLDLLV